MPKFFTIASGSSGNCSCFCSGKANVLIDAGVSCKGISEGLVASGISPQDIDAILITHEHIDHIRGLRVFSNKFKKKIFASAEVIQFICQNKLVEDESLLFNISKCNITVRDMDIHSFSTPHDSVGSLGFTLTTSKGVKAGIATDLGIITEKVAKNLSGCSMVLLESNYDENMLNAGGYPYYLKRRILSENGHLSNINCGEFAASLAKSGTTRFVLAHLSKDNNFPDLAFQTTLSTLTLAGFKEHFDFKLTVAPRCAVSAPILL